MRGARSRDGHERTRLQGFAQLRVLDARSEQVRAKGAFDLTVQVRRVDVQVGQGEPRVEQLTQVQQVGRGRGRQR